MRLLVARAGEDRFAFESLQLVTILPWPLETALPWGSLHALAGLTAEEPEPRAVVGRSSDGTPFALRVPGPLGEEDAGDVLPVPPLLGAPRWVRGFILTAEGGPALLLDLPSLGDAVLARTPPSPLPEAPT